MISIISIVLFLLVVTSPYKANDARLYLFIIALIILLGASYFEGKENG